MEGNNAQPYEPRTFNDHLFTIQQWLNFSSAWSFCKQRYEPVHRQLAIQLGYEVYRNG